MVNVARAEREPVGRVHLTVLPTHSDLHLLLGHSYSWWGKEGCGGYSRRAWKAPGGDRKRRREREYKRGEVEVRMELTIIREWERVRMKEGEGCLESERGV